MVGGGGGQKKEQKKCTRNTPSPPKQLTVPSQTRSAGGYISKGWGGEQGVVRLPEADAGPACACVDGREEPQQRLEV